MVVFADALSALAARSDSGPALRVLVHLWRVLSFETWRQLRQVDVAERVGLDRSTVSKALAVLLEAGLVERQGGGPRQEWRLHESSGWRGKAARYQMRKRERAAGLRVIAGGADGEAPADDA